MPEGSNKPFVVTDRRRFTTEGEVRPDAPPLEDRSAERSETRAGDRPDAPSAARSEPPPRESIASSEDPAPIRSAGPQVVTSTPGALTTSDSDEGFEDTAGSAEYPAPTEEQAEQSRLAYQATADRLDTAIRATNPGMDHPPAASFEQLVQSLYMTALVQLGGVAPEGQKPQIDLLGARQSIDLLGVLTQKTRGNLSSDESKFLDSALFELRMAFLEITQVLARSAAARTPADASPLGTVPGPIGLKR